MERETKYKDIIDADEFTEGILERAKKAAVSNKDRTDDVIIGSRHKKRSHGFRRK